MAQLRQGYVAEHKESCERIGALFSQRECVQFGFVLHNVIVVFVLFVYAYELIFAAAESYLLGMLYGVCAVARADALL